MTSLEVTSINPQTDPRCLHVQAIKTCLPSPKNIAFFNNLITLYSKSNLQSALQLFHSIPCANAVTWTAIISAFSNTPLAITLFLSLLRHPTRTFPTARTFASILKTCAFLPNFTLGPQLQSLSFKLSLSKDAFISSAFVSLYCKTRDVDSACKVFDEMSERDEVCFAAIINGLAQNNRPVEAIRCFVEMMRENVLSTCHSISGVLRAASGAAMLEQCRIIHGHALIIGLDLELYVGTALIDGYGKCGLPDEARRVFNQWKTETSGLNVAMWNAMMAAYAQQGSQEKVVELFRLMESREMQPDGYSFLSVLTAFNNVGLIAETEMWFNKMEVNYQIEPKIEHYTCLVGAMGKAGRLEEAEKLILTMPYVPDAAIWHLLLSIYASNGKSDMGWKLSEKLLEINPSDHSAFVILANGFASEGRWDEVNKVWKMMRDKRVSKEVGKSWIEVSGDFHVFFAGDKRHARKDEIYAKLVELKVEIEKLGYVQHEDGEKREEMWYHIEN